MDFTLVCDIMMDLEGSIRPAMYLANALIGRGHNVSMMSPVMSPSVEENLKATSIVPVNLQVKLVAKNSGLSLLWFETWAREAFLNLNSRHVNAQSTVAVNFSHTIVVPSMFWYLQGPTSKALLDIRRELNAMYRLVYEVSRPMIEFADGKLVKDMDRNSTFCVANSKFCASMYRKWGIRVSEIIYPPINCRIFRPNTSNPSSDYVLAYFGKETKFSIVKAVADLGVRIKAFGSKAPFIPRSLTSHPNIDFLGRISAHELVDVYTNAIFTFFPFTHEPFGYIPVESMACGTPTLTYDSQGPSESIVDGYSGWFVKDDAEIISKAVSIWRQGYRHEMRKNCVKEASKYDESIYVNRWLQILEEPPAKDLQAEATPLLSIGSLPVKTPL
jgi:glycosyltransferase involved in cell wall biosynthesis